MHKVWVTIMLAAVALAGCADNGALEPQSVTAVDNELQATDSTGVIRGVVVDPAITPVIGATVRVLSLDRETLTTEDGSFGFSDLEPGTYFLEVSKIAFDTVQTSVEVIAGVDLPKVVHVQLVPQPSKAPYLSMLQFSGNLACGLATPAASFGCSVVRGTEDVVGEYNGYSQTFDVIPDHLQVEMVWDSTQPAGESLYLGIRHCCDNDQLGGEYSGSRGPSPQTVWVNKTNLLAHQDGAVATDGVEISTFPSGLEDLEANGVRLGVILDQKFDYFTTEFYNFLPAEGWTFVADGPHPVPS